MPSKNRCSSCDRIATDNLRKFDFCPILALSPRLPVILLKSHSETFQFKKANKHLAEYSLTMSKYSLLDRKIPGSAKEYSAPSWNCP